MDKKTSGLILIALGIAMNAVGRLFMGSGTLAGAGFAMLWMFAATVIFLFGLFRLVVGLIRKE